MRSINNLYDVVDWGLCVGCGACAYACGRSAIALKNIEHVGIRPILKADACAGCAECLSFCPGYAVHAQALPVAGSTDIVLGPVLKVWEGHAADDEIRWQASSGGILTALSLYCLEHEKMGFVLHTAMDPDRPWLNRTVQSFSRADLLQRTGSRYAPSSPCDSLALIEQSPAPCVFIGKPCDVAAVSRLRRQRPELDRKLGLVLTFFCAGTPSTRATLDLMSQMQMPPPAVREVRYRGRGWPGDFCVASADGTSKKGLSYKESWHLLQKQRPFRCHLCADGLGQLADLSCGDAWHCAPAPDAADPGRSLVIARTGRGRDLVEKALGCGCLVLNAAGPADVFAAQQQPRLRRQVFGRFLAMRLLFIPHTRYIGYELFRAWLGIPAAAKLKTVLGTLRRLIVRGYWKRRGL